MEIQGIVNLYRILDGFGFITTIEEPSRRFFLHWSQLKGIKGQRLYRGQKVAFEIGEFNGRPVAINIRVLELPDPSEILPAP